MSSRPIGWFSATTALLRIGSVVIDLAAGDTSVGSTPSRSLSDLKNRSEKEAERGQILTISPGNSRSIAQESGDIWTAQPLLQPISFKFDRLLGQTPSS